MGWQLVAPVESGGCRALWAHVMPSITHGRLSGKGDGDGDGATASLCLNFAASGCSQRRAGRAWVAIESCNCLAVVRLEVQVRLLRDFAGSPGYTLDEVCKCLTEETRTIPSPPGSSPRLLGHFRLLGSWKRRSLECLGDMLRCWPPIASVCQVKGR